MSLFFAVLLAATQAVAPSQAPATPPPVPQNASPATPQVVAPPKPPVVTAIPDPASSHFLTDAGLLLVTIKPDSGR